MHEQEWRSDRRPTTERAPTFSRRVGQTLRATALLSPCLAAPVSRPTALGQTLDCPAHSGIRPTADSITTSMTDRAPHYSTVGASDVAMGAKCYFNNMLTAIAPHSVTRNNRRFPHYSDEHSWGTLGGAGRGFYRQFVSRS